MSETEQQPVAEAAEAPKRKPRARRASKQVDTPVPEGAEASSQAEKPKKTAKAAKADKAEKAPKQDDAPAQSSDAAKSPEGDSSSAGERTPRRHSRVQTGSRSQKQQNGKKGNGQSNGNGQNNGGKNNNRHQRRGRNNRNERREVAPKTSLEELSKLKVAELREKAAELEIDSKGLLKADLVQAVYDASVKKEGFVEVEGVLDILSDGYGFLRTEGYLPGEHDCYVATSLIRRNHLRKGDYVRGQVRPARENEKFAAIQHIHAVNGVPLEEMGRRPHFKDLTPVYPDERLNMEHGRTTTTSRVIDLVAPIGKGQRGLIVSPPKAGKTTVLKQIAAAISANNPEVHLMCLLVDERPEEVTDMQRSIKGEVIASTFDMPSDNHIAVAEMVIERAKRLVEMGEDVVILLDSITRLARAYNLAQPASGRILSGGVDSTALYPPKRFLGAARNIEHGGSLTILASALIDTGSKMDEVIFEEFKGTGNMELKLDRNLADRRIYPAIDPVASGTRKEDLLLDPQEAPLIWAVRRILANMNNTERAMDMLIKSLKQTETNQEFLLRTAKKAQGRRSDDKFEL
ncbi:transcription termination factor Rho [Denitrobacterium detoxificans]|uniref:Transcription termination factor Rho n=1 Tax=Denitrobacterium detoxificans TaxID=79604 RepID=A0A172RZ02_9ACTN|nr:transcription termination factor Rho [Denitrobacterium detoxificans]ANE22885.1 transcription termination factor Rho [Denitrobacterium detoxificans]SEO70489.1 transcription termination factor Rho [Denitrobacterium detoxificans]